MCQVTMQQIGRVQMIEKIIKYEVKVSVPSSQASQHLKKFENVIYKTNRFLFNRTFKEINFWEWIIVIMIIPLIFGYLYVNQETL